ncbi:MAG TPA: type IV-A pilus assembly ATPase PilB [Acidobacteriota bacterium]|nr:type IV-A pilus assembly ATPase PilB [Acidobacteriota bacterium]
MQQDNLGLKLLEARLITPEALQKAQQQVKAGGGQLTAALIKIGALSESDLTKFLGDLYGVASIDLSNYMPDPSVVKIIPSDVANKFQVVPISKTGRRLQVAMANPANIFAIDDIKFITGCEVQPLVASEAAIKKAIDKAYDSAASFETVMRGLDDDIEVIEDQMDEGPDVALLGEAEQAPVVKLVNSLISDAVRKGASDIHIEPYERALRVRFRIDGTLYEMMSPPFRMKAAMISRLKIMAELDIAERRVPQDGRIKLRLLGRTIDLRVSSLPTIFGEKVVMRILDKGNLNIDLNKLGFQEQALNDFTRAISMPYGMVLVTGPTGSGKTTTLYSALSKINMPEVNIMTAEDPVEYNLDGINQVLVNDDVGLSFAAALRSFLRQDPNIIMVGEIRDIDTGSIAVKAALTGHLVLSTLHTNDAPSTINRMVDMGIEPFLVASSTNLIMAQRLLRKICAACKSDVRLHPEVLRELGIADEDAKNSSFKEGKGCVECNNTGYKGRVGVYEVMPVTAKIRDQILDRSSVAAIKKQAVAEGMLTLRADGLLKLKNGVTTAEEVLKETAADR